MSHTTLRTGLALTLALSASTAMAAPFGQKGEFAFSADRLFGAFYANADEEGENADSVTEIAFMGQSSFVPLAVGGVINPYSMPKVGFDYFVIDGLTIGGSLVYASTSHTATRELPVVGGTVSNDTTGSAFVLAPRVGYAYMFSDVVGIWPRGGFTYHHQSAEDDGSGAKVSLDGFALSVDAPFVISPVEHFGFLVGPGLDLGLSGSAETSAPNTPTVSTDAKLTGFGLYAGLMGWI